MEAAISYADSHIAHLEAALTDVVNEVLQERKAEDPLAEISTRLFQKHVHMAPPHVRRVRTSREALVEVPKAKPTRNNEVKARVLDEGSEPVFACSGGTASGELPAAIAVATSTLGGGSEHATGLAMRQAARSLHEQLRGEADLVLCFCTEHHNVAAVEAAARALFGGIPFAANTTHHGLATELGSARVNATDCPAVLALWAIRDAAGSFAVAGAAVGPEADYAAAGMAAAGMARAEIAALAPNAPTAHRHPDAPAQEALPPDAAGDDSMDPPSQRRHEELLWLLTAPGQEEAVLGAMCAGLPARTVVLGSSSADEALGGLWWQMALSPRSANASCGFCPSSAKAAAAAGVTSPYASEGVVVVLFRPSLDFTPVFSHGFSSTVHHATVSANGGAAGGDARVLKELSVRNAPPEAAALVYNKWAGGYFDEEIEAAKALQEGDGPIDILGKSSEFPLGVAGSVMSTEPGEVEADAAEPRATDDAAAASEAVAVDGAFTCSSSVLLHPAFIHRDLSITVFARAPVGTRVQLLVGTSSSIVRRIAVFGEALDERAPFSRESVLGSLVFFCGGVMDCVVKAKDAFKATAAFGMATLNKPFVAVHPFGEQCFQSAWERPVHANLMFGGVIFGKATYGLLRRAEIFLSYQWGKELVRTGASEVAGFETQAIVAGLKTSLERQTRLACWFDLDCMGAGVDIIEAMEDGVTRSDVFVCCLTDRYIGSVNCMRELSHAVAAQKLIIPLLLSGYGEAGAIPRWPPPEPSAQIQHTLSLPPDLVQQALAKRLYVDLRTSEMQRANFPSLVTRIDSEVRRRRAARRWETALEGAAKAGLR